MLELIILKEFISNKDSYNKYRNFVKDKEFEKELRPILTTIDEWYKNNTTQPTTEDIAAITLSKVADKSFLSEVFNKLQTLNPSSSVVELLESYRLRKISEEISLVSFEVSEGRRSVNDLLPLLKKLESQDPIDNSAIFVTDDLDEILQDTVKRPGLRWRLNSLNHSLGSLRKGDFGFIFARPETGKTTFLTSEVSYMAEQLKNEDGPILLFNNEEQGKKVKLRLYQAALGARLDHLLREPAKAKGAFLDRTKHKIKIIDSASVHRRQVEAICAQENPSLILFDQIDKIKGFNDDREDLVMGAIYQWARELAKTYAPVIGICQADGTAEGEKWLHMGHVSNAKTAKQAEADWILGIGKTHEPGFEFIRYINISKNKLSGDEDTDPGQRHAKIQVEIQPDIARYKDFN